MAGPREVTDDDVLRQLHERGEGFLYNDFSGLGATGHLYNVLHVARCPWVPRSNTNVRKFFFPTLEEAKAWLTSERGDENIQWKRCGTCRAHDHLATDKSSESVPPIKKDQLRLRAPIQKQPDQPFVPFKEERVEKSLVSLFEAQGFSVEMRVVVASGIIDFVARRDEEVWVIEAKGEDRGGYNSAEMNLRIGFGQTGSRMDDGFSSARFGLAIPLTRDFKRALRKFGGSIAFEKLGLWLFAVHETEGITRVAPEDARSFITGLT